MSLPKGLNTTGTSNRFRFSSVRRSALSASLDVHDKGAVLRALPESSAATQDEGVGGKEVVGVATAATSDDHQQACRTTDTLKHCLEMSPTPLVKHVYTKLKVSEKEGLSASLQTVSPLRADLLFCTFSNVETQPPMRLATLVARRYELVGSPRRRRCPSSFTTCRMF